MKTEEQKLEGGTHKLDVAQTSSSNISQFSAIPNLGMGVYSIPIEVPEGRNGFQPQLALSYNSSGGNGYFGMGWSMEVPEIIRNINKGVPKYNDEADTFLISGIGEVIKSNIPHNEADVYLPSKENSFSRIYYFNKI